MPYSLPATLTLLLLFGLLTLASCSAFDQAQGIVAERGAGAADEALESGEWVVCSAASVASISRKYGSSPDRLRAWGEFCDRQLVSEALGGPRSVETHPALGDDQ